MSLFTKNTLYYKINLMPGEICTDIDSVLLNKLKNEIGNKCVKEGYVRRDSIEILKRSIGQVDAIHFNGRIGFSITYSAEICNPTEGLKLEGKILDMNKMGAMVNIEPLSINLPKQLHSEDKLEIFKNLSVGDNVSINIVGCIFELFDTEINAVGTIVNKV